MKNSTTLTLALVAAAGFVGSAWALSPPQAHIVPAAAAAAAAMPPVMRTVRASGRIETDRRLVATVTADFPGVVERLHVTANGQPVGLGQPLLEVSSPEFIATQREYAAAALAMANGDTRIHRQESAAASLRRLRAWNIPAEQLEALARTGEVRRSMVLRSPVTGVVTSRNAVPGMRFRPGEPLLQVTDPGSVRVVAEVAGPDIAGIRVGAHATVRTDAYPDKAFSGIVTGVDATPTAQARTVSVRMELPNRAGLLKPGMSAQVELPAGGADPSRRGPARS